MEFRVLVFFCLNGIANSTCYFLLAAGLNLIFGLLGILNFAQGALFMIGAYFTFQFLHWTDNFWLSIFFAPLVAAAVGVLIERYLLRRTYDIDVTFQMLLTFGLILVIEDIIRFIWGVNWYTVSEPDILRGAIPLLGWDYPVYNVFYTGVGFTVFVCLWLFMNKTLLGKKIVAASSDKELASGLGINVPRLFTIVFAIGAWLAGLMGVFHGPLVNINLDMGHKYMLTAFAVVVIGGLGKVHGVYVVSLLLGQLEAFGILFVPFFERIFMWGLMIIILILRPRGLFGERKQ
ncbi:MAG: branched-chain amino acid ABC transporter permease [Desulfobacteraceae bacterium]